MHTAFVHYPAESLACPVWRQRLCGLTTLIEATILSSADLDALVKQTTIDAYRHRAL